MDRPSRCAATAQCTMIWGVTSPNSHDSRAMANRPAPLQEGARSTRRGLRVGVVDSLGGGFVGGAAAVDRSFCCATPASPTTVLIYLAQS